MIVGELRGHGLAALVFEIQWFIMWVYGQIYVHQRKFPTIQLIDYITLYLCLQGK